MIRALGIVLVCIAGAYWLAFLLVAHVVTAPIRCILGDP